MSAMHERSSNRRRLGLGVAVLGCSLGALLWSWAPQADDPVEPVVAEVAEGRRAPVAVPRRRRAAPPAPAPREPHAPPPSLDGEPTPEDDDGRAWLAIDVVDADGRPAERGRVVPSNCPGFGYDPGRALFFAEPGTCELRAMRRDGALFARSQPIAVELSGGDVNHAQLELSTARTGGIGIRFRPGQTGMQVLSLVEGAPAWEAGLEVGDEVVSVDGVDVRDMSTEAFVEAMTGAEGTEVTFEVRFEEDGEEVIEQIVVTRAYLDG
jgi:hypothetical protein